VWRHDRFAGESSWSTAPECPPSDAGPSLAELAKDAGLRRIHVLAWRDVEHPDAGGSEIYVRNVVGRWAAAGLDVTLRTGIVPNRTGSQRRDDVHVVRRGGRVTSLVRGPASEVVRRDGQRDGLVEIWHGLNSLAPLWARGPRIAVVHHVGREARYVLPIPAALAVETMERRVSPLLYARTPIVTLSESSRTDLIALGYRPGNVNVVNPGVQPMFRPGGTRSASPLLLTVGRLVLQKRVGMLIDAADALRHRHPGLCLLVVGVGPERNRLEEAARHLRGTVRFLGRVTDHHLVELYRSAWALVSASAVEGWNLTISEAGACATPAVVSNVAGHRDAVTDGVGGLLAVDAAALESKLDRVLADQALRSRLGAGALASASRLSWDHTARETFSVLAADAVRRSRRRSADAGPTGNGGR
jgi:glycosyltransferase involved in cell wall biosynthesis